MITSEFTPNCNRSAEPDVPTEATAIHESNLTMFDPEEDPDDPNDLLTGPGGQFFKNLGKRRHTSELFIECGRRASGAYKHDIRGHEYHGDQYLHFHLAKQEDFARSYQGPDKQGRHRV